MGDSTVKHITVTVNASTGVPVCTPDPLTVKAPNSLLVFKLETDGYVFRDPGAIVVSSPGDDFPYASWTISGTSAALYDENNDDLSYNYTVYLTKLGTGEVVSVDPTIKNGQ